MNIDEIIKSEEQKQLNIEGAMARNQIEIDELTVQINDLESEIGKLIDSRKKLTDTNSELKEEWLELDHYIKYTKKIIDTEPKG